MPAGKSSALWRNSTSLRSRRRRTRLRCCAWPTGRWRQLLKYCSPTALRDPRRQGQEIEEFVLHGHRGVDREAIETAHFTRVTVHGKLLLKTIDQGKGSAGN